MKKALVIGYGISGRGAEKLLQKLGYDVKVTEQSQTPLNETFDLAILSPGIPMTHPVPADLKNRKVPVIGEVELAFRYLKGQVIGITGTKGKTTLTTFIAHVLRTPAIGNVGQSVAAYVAENNRAPLVVVELSSYQLETLETKKLDVAVITNIAPDHQDRYPSFDAYVETKWKIASCLKERGCCIIPQTLDHKEEVKVQKIGENSYLHLSHEEGYWAKLDEEALSLASAVCEKFGKTPSDVLKALETFEKPPHRLEWLGKWNEVTFVNDSKGTTPASTLYAMKKMKGPVILIVGGENKGLSFESWKEGLGKNIKTILTIGKVGEELKNLLAPFYKVYYKSNLEEATSHALQIAQAGDTILLSPGCASFDQFKNYAQRGEVFKNSIQQLRSVL